MSTPERPLREQSGGRKFWISWYQPTEDYRPLHDPPNHAVLGWWCSGYGADDSATLCALVKAPNERAAKNRVRVDWPEACDWRFCDAVASDWKLSDRFPADKGWMKERLGKHAA